MTKYHFCGIFCFMTFRDGFAGIDLVRAKAVTNAFMDRYFSEELEDEEILSPTAELEFPVLDVIMSALGEKLEARKTGDQSQDEVIDALADGGSILLAILVEIAEVEALDQPPSD